MSLLVLWIAVVTMMKLSIGQVFFISTSPIAAEFSPCWAIVIGEVMYTFQNSFQWLQFGHVPWQLEVGPLLFLPFYQPICLHALGVWFLFWFLIGFSLGHFGVAAITFLNEMPATNTPFQRAMQLSCQHTGSRIFLRWNMSRFKIANPVFCTAVGIWRNTLIEHYTRPQWEVCHVCIQKISDKIWKKVLVFGGSTWFCSCVSSSSSCWTGCSSDGKAYISGPLVMISSILFPAPLMRLSMNLLLKSRYFKIFHPHFPEMLHSVV